MKLTPSYFQDWPFLLDYLELKKVKASLYVPSTHLRTQELSLDLQQVTLWTLSSLSNAHFSRTRVIIQQKREILSCTLILARPSR